MSFEKKSVVKLDRRNRCSIPMDYIQASNIKEYVTMKLTEQGILITPYDISSLSYCTICKNINCPLIEFIPGNYICSDCFKKIAKKVNLNV